MSYFILYYSEVSVTETSLLELSILRSQYIKGLLQQFKINFDSLICEKKIRFKISSNQRKTECFHDPFFFLYSPLASSWIVKPAQTKTEVGIYFSNFFPSAPKLGTPPKHTMEKE